VLRKTIASFAVLIVTAAPAFAAMTIREFRKFTTAEQGLYVGAAISMLVYTYAAEGKPVKARCIQNWYYGEPGKPTPGPQATVTELAIAEQSGADKFTVEGVLLGLTDKVCDVPPEKPSTDKK